MKTRKRFWRLFRRAGHFFALWRAPVTGPPLPPESAGRIPRVNAACAWDVAGTLAEELREEDAA